MNTLFEEPNDWDHFSEHGWWFRHDALPSEMVALLAEECLAEWEAGAFDEAGIGAGALHQINKQVRRDFVNWWSQAPQSPVRKRFLDFTEMIAGQLNQNLFLALHEIELHYAVYPPGGFYRRHLDRFRDRNNRQISLVLFLNENWAPEDGGQLRIYTAQGMTDILPHAGTLVLFRSDVIEHEVMPTHRTRLSLTGWFKNRSWPLV